MTLRICHDWSSSIPVEAQPQELADIWSMLRRTASPIFRRSSHLFCIIATYKPDVKDNYTYCVSVLFSVYEQLNIVDGMSILWP